MIKQRSPGDLATVRNHVSPPLLLRATDQAPRQARRFVADWCAAWGMDDDYLMRLAASELVTNAYRHGGGDTIIVRLFLGERDGLPGIEVWDAGEGHPVMRPENFAATNGRGVLAIDALAVEWGVRKPIEGGKVVWVRVPG
jgi:anti-sigma regulatory factor (Ser/Thr protein kinase)